jgi:hypothetical protein
MQTQSTLPSTFEMPTLNPANLISVENTKDLVVIRAAYNNFTPRRKAFLIRQLAAEGYIPDRFELVTEGEEHQGLLWVIDRSLLVIGAEAKRRSSRFMGRLLLGSCLLWLMEMALLWANR